MRVAIIHYHLGHGGVTRVIHAQSAVLRGAGIRHVVLTGSLPVVEHGNTGFFLPGEVPVHQVTGLGYDAEPHGDNSEQLLERMRVAASSALGGPPDIWHFHNHSLGKNSSLAGVVSRLAAGGERMLLQIHDLAEQGRPANYQVISNETEIYPFSSRQCYAFLNSRDRDIFQNAGLPGCLAIVLPNPIDVCPSAVKTESSEAPPLLFAPIRGIRRKNIGELVLISALLPEGARVAVSRAPEQSTALPVHDHWRRFAARQRLPIGFDVVDRYSPAPGASADFCSWLRHATHVVTTSVSEGFGLPMLESIGWEKPLLGRRLPHLAADHGIHFPHLYDRILIPVDWIDLTVLRTHVSITVERNYRAYSRRLEADSVESILSVLREEGLVDFGNLPEALQQEIVERLIDPASREIPQVEIGGVRMPMAEWLCAALSVRGPAASRGALLPFSPDLYERKLVAIYQQLMGEVQEEVNHLQPSKILDAFLVPRQFHFLLSELPPVTSPQRFKAVIFDIYGTLLIAPRGGVTTDPKADPRIRSSIEFLGYGAPDEPSKAIHQAVGHHHDTSEERFPEVDLRVLWREILSIPFGTDMDPVVSAIEQAWHPSTPMQGADAVVRKLARSGISLGLLSNAQCNTVSSLGEVSGLFAPELTVLSYQHGIAKPSPRLFQVMADRLAGRGIMPSETLYIGNDPVQDIGPGKAAGFYTALFTGHPLSIREGDCSPDFRFDQWSELMAFVER